MRVTAEKLEEAGACDNMIGWFKQRWPKGCEATLKNLTEAAEKDTYTLLWFAQEYLGDPALYVSLNDEEARLDNVWMATVEKRIINRAQCSGVCFVLHGFLMRRAQSRLREYKRNHKRELAILRKQIAAKLARMVYDKIKAKRAPAKRRKPK